MKLSANRNSPHYDASIIPCRVMLDGGEIKDCVFADEEEGFVEVLKKDENGHIVTNGDYFVYEAKFGKVEIVPLRQSA
jgi:hypothetical protein